MESILSALRTFAENSEARGLAIIFFALAGGFLFLIRYMRKVHRNNKKADNYRVALRMLDAMIARDPKNAMAYWQKGEVYEAMGMADRAIRFYQAAHEMSSRAYSRDEINTAYNRLKGELKFKPSLRSLTRV